MGCSPLGAFDNMYMYIKSALRVISNKIIITNYYYYYSIWSEAQSHLSKNIYNSTIRYINNSLPTRKNMARWGLSQSPDCSFCLNPESLLHVVAGNVNITLIASPGDTTQSLTSLPSHFSL